jgi:hypothetical protein
MSQISNRQQNALEAMLTNLLIQLPEKPITHLKKLLDGRLAGKLLDWAT